LRYVEFRDSICSTLHQHPEGLTWEQLKHMLDLPYKQPCQTWVQRMEREDGLVRGRGSGRAYLWRVKARSPIE